MRNRSWATLVALAFVCSLAFARVPVEVSEKYSAIVLDKVVAFPGKEALNGQIYPTRDGDSYVAMVSASGPGATVVTYPAVGADRKDFSKPTSYGEVKGNWVRRFDFSAVERDGIAIYVTPTAKKPIRARLTILRFGTRTVEQRAVLERALRFPLDTLDSVYELPKFKVSVKPCGQVNAYSAPDVTICTELINDLLEKGASDALPMVVLHEIGHTLLNLWGLPGWDNEDIVDEFAASLLATGRPEALRAMAKWLRSQDSLSAAAAQLSNDDRHSVPIQRARNIERILADAAAASPTAQGMRLSPTQMRWFALLGQHIKREAESVVTQRAPSEIKSNAPKPSQSPPTVEVEAWGTCDRLTIAGADATQLCAKSVRRTIYPSGRTAILVATLNKVPLILSTGPEERDAEGVSTFQVETVGVYRGQGEGIEYLAAHGKCAITKAAKSSTLQCNLATDKDGTQSGVRFRFQNWTSLAHADVAAQVPAGENKPSDSPVSRPSTTTVVEAHGFCDRLIIGGVDMTTLCGDTVQRTTYPTGRTGIVVATKHKVPLILSTAPEELTSGGVHSLSVETVGVYRGEGQGTEYLAAHGLCSITPASNATSILQCDLTTDMDGTRNGVRFRFRGWASPASQ